MWDNKLISLAVQSNSIPKHLGCFLLKLPTRIRSENLLLLMKKKTFLAYSKSAVSQYELNEYI